MKNRKIIFMMLIALFALLTVYGSEEKKSAKGGGANSVEATKFPTAVENNGKAVSGATLKIAMVKDSPLKGIFNEALYDDAYDGEIIEDFVGSKLFDVDGNFEVTDTGAATLTVDAPNKKATIKIKDNVKWNDGTPLTADDVIFAYEVVGHKDYTGVRYNEERKMIVGIEDYHAGKTPTISGIKKIDDRTVEISFIEMGQGIYTIGNGLLGYALSKKDFAGVPIKEMVSSPKSREKIMTTGPYYITKTVQGESLELKANEHYFKGKAKIDRVTIQVVNSQRISAATKSGEYDIILKMRGYLYPTIKDLGNITVLGRQELYYSYLGFKLGKWDEAQKKNIMNPNAKMGDVKLRQALVYGLDVDQISKIFYHGLGERAISSVPPVFKKYYPEGLEGFPYNPEKAKKLLDEAGYKDANGDGIREGKDGKPFEVRIAAMAGGDIAEPLAQFYIQNWKEIGIKAVLATGRLMEFNEFYDKVQADNPEIDVFFGAWGVGINLNPIKLAGKDSKFNYTRFVTEENTKLMTDVISEKGLREPGYKAAAYKKWQEYYIPMAAAVPLTYRYEIVPVNKRVKNFRIDYNRTAEGWGYHLVELTADAPVKF